MRIRITTALLLLVGVVSGCATGPTQYQLDMADYGLRPDETVARSAATMRVQAALKDPSSAIFTWGTIHRSWFREDKWGSEIRYAWKLPFHVNAKNSYGGYTGRKPYTYYFRGNTMVGFTVYYKGLSSSGEFDGIAWPASPPAKPQ